MQPFRLIPAALLASASTLFAQLPPSALNPGRPGPAPVQPGRPGAATAPAPGVRPGAPAATAPAATSPVAPSAAPAPIANGVPNTLGPEEMAQGWKLLFDGKSLVGLRGVQKRDPLASGWKIQNGELVLPKSVQEMDKLTGGDLATAEQYWDFEFRFEWKATVSANSGVRYLVNSAIGQPPTGLEYQIVDDTHNPISFKGQGIRRTGALDNILPVGANAKLRTGDPLMKEEEPWNEGRILVQGNRVEHWLNGEKVLEFVLGPQLRATAERNFNREEPFAVRPHATFGLKGRTPIVLVDQGTEVAFRNLKVRPLAPQAVAPATAPAGTAPRAPAPNPFLLPPGSAAGRR